MHGQVQVFVDLPDVSSASVSRRCPPSLFPSRLLVSASQDGKLIIWDSYTTNKVSGADTAGPDVPLAAEAGGLWEEVTASA